MSHPDLRREVRRLLDLGRTDGEIAASLADEAPRTVRRILASLHEEDTDKNSLELASERVIRLAEDQLADPTLPPTARTRALQTLQKAQIDLLRARSEVHAVPGAGTCSLNNDGMPELDDPLLDGRPPIEEDEEYWTAQAAVYNSAEQARRYIGLRREALNDPDARRGQELDRLQWLADLEVEAQIEEMGEDAYFASVHESLAT